MVTHKFEKLRQRADRYQQIALRMTDTEAVRALTTLAQNYVRQADEADAAQHTASSINHSS